MSQYDPSEFDEIPDPTRYRPSPPTSGMAIASLVCGVMICGLMATSILAVIFGIVGLQKTRGGAYGGRGLAISGLILGLVGVGAWLFAGSTIYIMAHNLLREQAKARTVATRFVQDVSEGKIDAAMERALPGLDRAKLAAASETMKAGGPFNELAGDFQPIPDRRAMDFRWELAGDVIFSRDRKPVRMSLAKDGNGEYRIERFDLE